MGKNWLEGAIALAVIGSVAWKAVQVRSAAPPDAQQPPASSAPDAEAARPQFNLSIPAPPAAAPMAQVAAPTEAPSDMPPVEMKFIELIRRYADLYRAGANEMVQGATRPARAKAICELFQNTRQHHVPWVGTVTRLSSTNAGEGVLTISIADDVTLGTTNNEFSESLGDSTLLQPGTSVFEQAIKLHVGQRVLFRGNFVPSTTDCFLEKSLFQKSSMTQPEWAMRFTSLAPADQH